MLPSAHSVLLSQPACPKSSASVHPSSAHEGEEEINYEGKLIGVTTKKNYNEICSKPQQNLDKKELDHNLNFKVFCFKRHTQTSGGAVAHLVGRMATK
ncbi:hypothetical protein PoB_007641000 [Plakobranchus ocellatus]|uniref:Uncharacterized protein n=1 Tax=Plakobranchus ocellatus TaxID=259542 RepID=A0AAV4E0P2_9GAST|nr:hypothetical protein PoB_007641000 [Plakobranchus ocellatus]